jgi:hypothetical protein
MLYKTLKLRTFKISFNQVFFWISNMKVSLILIIVSFYEVIGKTKVIPDERVQYCDGPPLGSGQPLVGNITTIDADFLVSDDEKVSLNGTVLFKKNIDGNFVIKYSGEQLLLGDWHLKLVKVQQDACIDLFNPVDVFYPFFQDKKRCPLQPGVSFSYIFSNIVMKI